MNKKYLAFWAIPAALMLGACGDDSSSNGPDNMYGSDFVVGTHGELPDCSEKLKGVLAYVKGEKKAYTCEDGKWVLDDDGSESSKNSSSSASLSGENHDDSSSSIVPPSSSSVLSSASQEQSSSSNASESSSSVMEEPESSSSVGVQNDFGNRTRDEFLHPTIEYGSFEDSRDNQVYKTIRIGTQTWFAQNLNYADSVKTPSIKGKSYCYNDNVANCEVAGRLYTWEAAVVVCPEGWRLPTMAEYTTLLSIVGGSATAGVKLKSAIGWNEDEEGYDGNGTDEYGFSALPAGAWFDEEDGVTGFDLKGESAWFWTASEFNYQGEVYGNGFSVTNYKESASIFYHEKAIAMSVRCIKE